MKLALILADDNSTASFALLCHWWWFRELDLLSTDDNTPCCVTDITRNSPCSLLMATITFPCYCFVADGSGNCPCSFLTSLVHTLYSWCHWWFSKWPFLFTDTNNTISLFFRWWQGHNLNLLTVSLVDKEFLLIHSWLDQYSVPFFVVFLVVILYPTTYVSSSPQCIQANKFGAMFIYFSWFLLLPLM